MAVFEDILWGYALTCPDDWVFRADQDSVHFVAVPEALEPGYEGPHLGYLLARTEWNGAGKELEPLWNQHLSMVAGMLGAKQIASVPWTLGAALGFEAEIVMPKRIERRLWTGILTYRLTVFHFVVEHRLEDKDWFEPLATRIISSLRFPRRMAGVESNSRGVPLPPRYVAVEPSRVVEDIQDPTHWEAYDGTSSAGALQAFYLREAALHGWMLQEYVPFPGPSDLGFARLTLQHGQEPSATGRAVLGILPYGESQVTSSSPARLAIKYIP